MQTLSNYIKMSRYLLLPSLALFGLPLAAQTAAPVSETPSIWGNPTFLIMLFTAIVLLVVIISLSATVKNLIDSERSNLRKSNGNLPVALLALALGVSSVAHAQAPESNDLMPPQIIGGLDSWIFLMMLIVIIAEFLVILGLIRSIRHLLIGLGYQQAPDPDLAKPWINWKWLDRQLTDAVPIENEAEVMTDHEYDGIRELDNNLPPWWVYGFYFTIIFGVVYLFNYHISGTSPLPAQEYQEQLAEAELEKKSHLAEVGASVDETTVTAMTDATLLSAGKDIYSGNCAACHGQAGEGGVGPNLTDEYWIHGGGIQNVFKTIKYGVPAKGMIAWQTQLKPDAMQKVASYILTLQGTKPANGKEPQGTVWTEEVVPTAPDSATVKVDSTTAATAALN